MKMPYNSYLLTNPPEVHMELLSSFLSSYGIFAIIFIVFLEYACFPISSEIVLPLAGYFAANASIPYLLLVPCSVLAGLLGTSLCYAAGRFGGTPFLEALVRRFPKTKKGIEASVKYFKKRGPVTVCVLRVVPLCRTYIAFPAGALAMDYRLYFLSSLLGITIWNSLLIAAGFKLGEHFHEVSTWYHTYRYVVLVVLLLVIAALLSIRHLRKSSELPD